MYKKIIICSLLLLFSVVLFAQGIRSDTSSGAKADIQQQTSSSEGDKQLNNRAKILFSDFSEFPNLHPLVIHFPVVLLLLSFFSMAAGLFVYRTPLSWVTLTLLAGGFAGAILASQVYYPQLAELPESTYDIFAKHRLFADITTWLAGTAFILKVISHFIFRNKTWADIVIFLIITASALTVSLAGHLGARMVYLKEMEKQEKYMEQHK